MDMFINPFTGKEITTAGLICNFNFESVKLSVPHTLEVCANDPVIKSFGIVIEQYFGAFLLEENDIQEVVQYVNSRNHTTWWNSGDSLHSKLVEANYEKTGKCSTTMEG